VEGDSIHGAGALTASAMYVEVLVLGSSFVDIARCFDRGVLRES